MNTLRASLLLAAKDLRIERRGYQTLGLVIVLGVLIVVVLAMALGTGGAGPGPGAAAILWVAYLFGGTLCFEKTMAVERQDDALAGLLLAPIERGAVFAGKLLANLTLMFCLAAVITPVGILLFHFDLSAAPVRYALITTLGMIGFAAIGTLFAAAAASSRLQGGLLAMLVFPLTLPVVLTSTQLMLATFDPARAQSGAAGLSILVAFDVIFLAASWLAFDLLIEP
ncbi:MAG: heme exporter protein CcmB [Phycisphaerales bacterium]|nr:heme exporter protein CcmB [Phycisphaerales bacterium]